MYKFMIYGVVQGVGFRPYIFRKATQHKLVGTVKNTGNGVEIIINDKDFIKKLTDLPPLAKISDFTRKEIVSKQKYTDFKILSSSTSEGETQLPPDIYMCNDCLKELNQPGNRRYKYYFITCTNCGPRFSIIEDYPYDRPLTSMRHFSMCSDCTTEYTNPLNRRYHAQTIACPNCGPKLHLLKNKEDISGVTDSETVKKTVTLLKAGEVIAIKGVGGFHLCSLSNDTIVEKVRHILGRSDKPFALLVKDISMAQSIAFVSDKEQQLLTSPQRPIVILKKKKPSFHRVSELDSLGIMLPYTALHYLLFDFIDEPLVMTSCNYPGEPVAISEIIGKYFLTHDRIIVNRCDDSVVKVVHDTLFFLRRSRGYTPLPVKMPFQCKDTLAVGGELNNAICCVKKKNCFLSQYIGDTSKFETFLFMKEAAKKLIKLTRLEPSLIACDLHPGYNSSFFAKELAEQFDAVLVPIQHHRAHIASVAAEHGFQHYVGIAMDGLGYGDNGELWGGEVFKVKDHISFRRVGHLELQPQLGGDTAAIYPKKMLFGILSKILSDHELLKQGLFDVSESNVYLSMLSHRSRVQLTSSTGRVLDAVAALLGLCEMRTYDGRPAMLLESVSTKPLDFEPMITRIDGMKVLLTSPLFRFLLEHEQESVGERAATAEMYIAKGLFEIAQEACDDSDIPIVFSGGVAYNSLISDFLISKGVYVNRDIPCGDGGTCFGQAYLANRYSL